MTLSKLKSGTDIRGTAIGENADLNDDAVKKITAGFLMFIKEKTSIDFNKMTIAVGRDSRISANRIKNAVITVLLSKGVKVLDCGLSSTPAMFMITISEDCTASIQITASHHPYDKNGLKFFTKDGGFNGNDIIKILEFAESIKIDNYQSISTVEKFDYMSKYADMLRDMICKGVNADNYNMPLDGFHIVTDAGNGVGGFYAEKVLKPLGADISGSLFLNPDGMFPNHPPNPENKTAMKFISKAVINSKADLGIIFDTDVDRAACVDCSGKEINRNRLIALASAIVLEKHPNSTIVTDSVTSDGLHNFIENQLGGKHHRFKRGYKNVINEAIRLENNGICCPLAIETSGHAALKENYFLDDGAYLITKIIIFAAKLKKDGKTVFDIISGLEMPEEEIEIRYNITCQDFKNYGERVINDLYDFAKKQEGWQIAPDNHEGIRISLDKNHGDGWMLLRLSVHDPVLPFNAESNCTGGIDKILSQFNKFITQYDKLKV